MVQSITTCRKIRRLVRNATPYSRWSKQLGGRRSRATAEAPKAIPAAAAAAAVNENSEVEVLDETDESIPEDTSDLVGDDDDDVGVVIDTGESKLDDN